MADVKITDNSKEFLSAFQKQIALGLLAVGHTAEGYAKEDCPVDTGRLRNDISNAVAEEEKAVYIGTNVEYAQYVEFRDNVRHETGKAHFLRDSASRHTDEYKEIVKSALQN